MVPIGAHVDRADPLTVAIMAAAGAPVMVETPGDVDGPGADIAFLRARRPA